MIVTLSGVTGSGKSYFKNLIINNMKFKNLVIYTTREKRKGEIDGKDKFFVSEEQFKELVNNKVISYYFDFLGYKYGYKKENLQSSIQQVTEVHYSTIYDFKKYARDVFSIYIIPNDIERAKNELRKRGLSKTIEKERLEEINDHIQNFSNNKKLQNQFDCILINNYDKDSEEKLLKIIKQKFI